MKKNISGIGLRTACAVVMSAILVVTAPIGLFGQSGRVFAEGGTTTCPYGGAGCAAAADGEHAHDVTIGGGSGITTISGGTFTGNYTITVKSGGKITGGTFNATDRGTTMNINVEHGGEITGGGTFGGVMSTAEVMVTGGGISGGTFNKVTVKKDSNNNPGKITGGTFNGNIVVEDGGVISGVTGTNTAYQVKVNSGGTITDGTFNKSVYLNGGSITGGYFWKDVTNESNGTISGGSFYGTVINNGSITGGEFVTLPVGVQEGGNIRIILYPFSGSASEVPVNSHTHITHTHSYSWVTVQEATVGQDGIEEYRCSCGDVQERCVIPASMVFVKGLYGAIKDASQNGTATFDSGRLYTISDYVIKKLAERSDVTTVITFEYQNQSYQMTIPAGADYTALLADQDYFYGYFYFANVVGAAIEAL